MREDNLYSIYRSVEENINNIIHCLGKNNTSNSLFNYFQLYNGLMLVPNILFCFCIIKHDLNTCIL